LIAGLNFVSGSDPTSVLNEATFLYNTATGILSYDDDGAGGLGSYIVAQFFQAPAITTAAFVFVTLWLSICYAGDLAIDGVFST